MSAPRVSIVDYGVGNLYSVRRALERCGAEPLLVSDAAGIAAAERLLLPGVGAFADGMAGLRERGLVEPIQRFAALGKPLLGICLGMQMLAGVSEEFGVHPGLGLMGARVVRVPDRDVDGSAQKVPHVGWSELLPAESGGWSGSPLDDTAPGTAVYLVHSYHVVPDDPAHLLAWCDYGGHAITAAVRTGNVFGCQFHPEKSGESGLRMLARFLRLT